MGSSEARVLPGENTASLAKMGAASNGSYLLTDIREQLAPRMSTDLSAVGRSTGERVTEGDIAALLKGCSEPATALAYAKYRGDQAALRQLEGYAGARARLNLTGTEVSRVRLAQLVAQEYLAERKCKQCKGAGRNKAQTECHRCLGTGNAPELSERRKAEYCGIDRTSWHTYAWPARWSQAWRRMIGWDDEVSRTMLANRKEGG